MFKTNKLAATVFLFLGFMTEGHADTSMMSDLMSMLNGEFESQKQMQEDKANQVPKEMAHGWVNRTLYAVDSPDAGDTLMVATTSYVSGDGAWYFDEYEFLVLTFVAEADGKSIRMFPRRFKEPEKRLPYSREPNKLAVFTADDLQPAISGSNCEIIWTRNRNGFTGKSKPCRVMSTTKNKMLDWQWQYELSQDNLQIEFSGTDEKGNILDGTPIGSPYRLDRVM